MFFCLSNIFNMQVMVRVWAFSRCSETLFVPWVQNSWLISLTWNSSQSEFLKFSAPNPGSCKILRKIKSPPSSTWKSTQDFVWVCSNLPIRCMTKNTKVRFKSWATPGACFLNNSPERPHQLPTLFLNQWYHY